MQINIEENVISLFREKGFERHQQLTQQITRRVLNQHSQFVMERPFKNQMLTEILNHCRYGKLQITPKGLGEVVGEAHHILLTRLKQLQGQQGIIQKHKQFLKIMQHRSTQIQNLPQPYYTQKQQKLQLDKDIQITKNELKQFQQQKEIFQEQFQIIDKLFKKYIPSAKLKKMSKIVNSNVQVNPKYLGYMFYMAVVGMFLETAAVQVRPGWIAIVVYLQVLFLVLVGYFNRKAVMYITFTAIVSIALDITAITLSQILQHQHSLYNINSSTIAIIFNIARKAALITSIILRIGIIFVGYTFMQPPLKRITFKIFGKQLVLNTRLKIARVSMSHISYSP